jgi:ligand-binding SRPBCC domain-containing protein
MPRIKLETYIKSNKEIVFDLSRSIDLHKVSAKSTNEKAIDGVTKGLIGLNEFVTWRAKHLGFYQNLSSIITQFDYPNSFTDEMLKGAFKSFKHQHLFEKADDNTTLMTDIFDYTSPFGILGKLGDFVILKRYLRKFLIERNRIIKNYAETGGWKKILNA